MSLFFAPYFFLALALVFLWIPFLRKAWYIPFLLAALLGLRAERLGILGVVGLSLLALSVYFSHHSEKLHIPRYVSDLCIAVLGALFLTHTWPGFWNVKAISSYQLSPKCAPFSLYLNFDKGSLGLILLAFLPQVFCRTGRDVLTAVKTAFFCTLVATLLLFLVSMILGYMEWDFKLAPFWKIWMFYNLFFVSIPEEAFFRGFLLQKIGELCGRWKSAHLIALISSSLLFGLYHFPGGLSFMILSFLAGILYGFAFLWSGKIEAAIGTHFCVNTIHFLAFSYPCLQT